ncbi:MAG TPA: insulinase family protein [Blastocatellia bacterium]|nr:insulinase family protein [Blastocatellia bacterium]
MQKLAVILLISLVLVVPVRTRTLVDGNTPAPVKTILENGTTVILIEDHSAPVISCQVYSRLGTGDELFDAQGSAFLAAYANVPGASQYNTDGGIVLDGGDEARSIISRDFVGLLLRGSMDKFDSMIERASKFATISQVRTEFPTLKKIATMRESTNLVPDETLRTVAINQIYNTAFRDQHARSFWNDEEGVTSLNETALAEFVSRAGSPDNLVVVIAGDFEPDYVNIVVKRWFGHRHAEKIPGDQAARVPTVKVTSGMRENTTGPGANVQNPLKRLDIKLPTRDEALSIGYKFQIDNSDLASLKLLGIILGGEKSSRLQIRFMDRASHDYRANVVDASLEAAKASGGNSLFSIYLEEPPSPFYSIWQSETFISDEITKLKQSAIDEQELTTAKRFLTAQYREQNDTIDGRAFVIARGFLSTGDLSGADDAMRAMLAVTAADIRRVANKYLVDDNRTAVTIVPVRR